MYLQHDTIPTGPPVKLPPHNLKGEAAAWVDEKLAEEVARGQLVRGTSPWGSPPFPTREFPSHRRQRKRRIVVDYRRVNRRTMRAIYYTRRQEEIKSEAAGSAFLTLLDAVTGFNQIKNTRRAMEMLAIIARCGQFLPICLTFGPHNGPEDFSYCVDRLFSPGRRGAKSRFCSEWLIYMDDVTVRTGRVLDGVLYTDAEHSERLKEACKKRASGGQGVQEALNNLGYSAKGVGSEIKKPRPLKKKYDPREADRNHPFAHNAWYLVRVFVCVTRVQGVVCVELSVVSAPVLPLSTECGGRLPRGSPSAGCSGQLGPPSRALGSMRRNGCRPQARSPS